MPVAFTTYVVKVKSIAMRGFWSMERLLSVPGKFNFDFLICYLRIKYLIMNNLGDKVISSSHIAISKRPSISVILFRGLCWGILFGQLWTFLILVGNFSSFRISMFSQIGLVLTAFHGQINYFYLIAYIVTVLGIIFAITGSIIGLIVALFNLQKYQATLVGMVFGMLLFGGEYYLTLSFVSLLFWILTGGLIGYNIVRSIQKPVHL